MSCTKETAIYYRTLIPTYGVCLFIGIPLALIAINNLNKGVNMKGVTFVIFSLLWVISNLVSIFIIFSGVPLLKSIPFSILLIGLAYFLGSKLLEVKK